MGVACVEWIGGRSREGYGQVNRRFGRIRVSWAHQAAFMEAYGFIPEQLHHACGNKACVNVWHLVPTTRYEHKQLDTKGLCKHGHDLAVTRYIAPNGRTHCRICQRERDRRYHAKEKLGGPV